MVWLRSSISSDRIGGKSPPLQEGYLSELIVYSSSKLTGRGPRFSIQTSYLDLFGILTNSSQLMGLGSLRMAPDSYLDYIYSSLVIRSSISINLIRGSYPLILIRFAGRRSLG